VNEVISLAGTQLDPAVVDALSRCNASGVLCAVYGLAPRVALIAKPTSTKPQPK
jgi:hypothetical protein